MCECVRVCVCVCERERARVQHEDDSRLLYTISAGSPINTTWIDGSLHFDWTGKFEATPPSPLTFELSLGTLTGSGIIRKWVELSTDYTQYTVSDSRLSEERDYFLTLLAISSSGLHTTATHMEAGVPPTST